MGSRSRSASSNTSTTNNYDYSVALGDYGGDGDRQVINVQGSNGANVTVTDRGAVKEAFKFGAEAVNTIRGINADALDAIRVNNQTAFDIVANLKSDGKSEMSKYLMIVIGGAAVMLFAARAS